VNLTPDEIMHCIDLQLSHVWVVRTFLKHSEEAEEDDELLEIVRELYDYCLAVGPAWKAQDAAEYLKIAQKKLPKARAAAEHFAEILPQVSAHTNFKMALASLRGALNEVTRLLELGTDE
jgi:hypothetical protein